MKLKRKYIFRVNSSELSTNDEHYPIDLEPNIFI